MCAAVRRARRRCADYSFVGISTGADAAGFSTTVVFDVADDAAFMLIARGGTEENACRGVLVERGRRPGKSVHLYW